MIASVSSAKLYARNNKELCTIDANVLERSETRVAAAVRKGYDKLEEIRTKPR